MSTCYLMPMAHDWQSFAGSAEPLSPSTSAPVSRAIPSQQLGVTESSIPAGTYSVSTNINWVPNFSLAHTHSLPIPSASPPAAVSTGPTFTIHTQDDTPTREQRGREQFSRESLSGELAHSSVSAGQGVPKVEDDDDEDMSGSDLDDIAEDQALPQTAAERRAAKRKMKRFRLTHSQTRFLLSEFARQPHPDAAQRERLSRDIPGLSSRQVQVWFQNRRAKLKRLSVDDRERMMRSRALPEDFDRSSLHSTLRTTPQLGANTALSPVYNPLTTGFQSRGSSYGHIRRISDESAISPSSNPSVRSESLWTSGSMPASEMQSPVSPVVDRGSVWGSIASQIPSPQNINPYGRSRSFPAIHHSQQQALRQYPQEHMARIRSGSLASPVAAGPLSDGPGQSAEVPIVFGRPCPPPLHEYSQQSQVGLPFQEQGIYAEDQEHPSPQAHSENTEQLTGESPFIAHRQFQASFIIPPSHREPQTHQRIHGQGGAHHQDQSVQIQYAPLITPQDYPRPPPEQYARPPFPPYPTQYSSQSAYTFGPTSPQTTNPPDTSPYPITQASISGPPTQQRVLAGGDDTVAGQRQQLHTAGRRRSFTHPPDYNVFR